MSEYLDNIPLEPGNIVMCTHNIASPWVKCGQEFVVRIARTGLFVIESIEGNTIVNPSARFKKCVDTMGFEIQESQWRQL